jgi:hypothetical protein
MFTPSDRRLLRGYGPLIGFVLVFVLVAAFVPTVAREQVTLRVAGGTGGGSGSRVDAGGGSTTGSAPGGGSGGGTASGNTAGSGGGGQGSAVTPQASIPASTSACPGRTKQVPGDPYSPPCIAFSGGNGGATSRGVTKDSITVAFRQTSDPGFQQTLASLGGASFSDTPGDIQRTVLGLAKYFNTHFQFYGRKLNFVFYNGQGSQTNELLGGGQQEANADAITVGQKIKAFADMSATTEPYGDALARQKVVGFGVPYLSREWMTERRPYMWSIATDCSVITETVSEVGVKQVLGKPAEHAGGDLKGKPRKPVILAPDNPWYQECVKAGLAIVKKAGKPVPQTIAYSLNLSTMSSQAASIIAKLKSEGVTTVICGCDPVIPVYLTSKAKEQNYIPEWVVTGTALTDQDIVGQLFDQTEWAHAFGISYAAEQPPQRATLGYAAYKSVNSDTPANAVDLIYQQMYMLALGVQLAGPDLTPQTFEQGMFRYPGGTGQYGTWGFGPGHYTPTQDAREIYWDPTRISKYNGKQGAYVTSSERYKQGHWPTADHVKAYQ